MVRTARAIPWLKGLLAVGLLGLGAAAHADYSEGVHYHRVGEPPAEAQAQVEVVEYFSYACPFCADFHPLIHDWLEERGEEVSFRQVPLAFRDDWEALARAYHIAEGQDALDAVHGPLFQAIHERGRQLDGRDALLDFLAERGVDRDEAASAWEGFAMDTALRRDARAAEQHGIDATPSVVIADAYRVTARTAGSLEAMIEIMDALVDRHVAD